MSVAEQNGAYSPYSPYSPSEEQDPKEVFRPLEGEEVCLTARLEALNSLIAQQRGRLDALVGFWEANERDWNQYANTVDERLDRLDVRLIELASAISKVENHQENERKRVDGLEEASELHARALARLAPVTQCASTLILELRALARRVDEIELQERANAAPTTCPVVVSVVVRMAGSDDEE